MCVRISPDIQVVIIPTISRAGGESLTAPRVDSESTFYAPNTAALRPFLTQASGRRLKLPRAPASNTAGALE